MINLSREMIQRAIKVSKYNEMVCQSWVIGNQIVGARELLANNITDTLQLESLLRGEFEFNDLSSVAKEYFYGTPDWGTAGT